MTLHAALCGRLGDFVLDIAFDAVGATGVVGRSGAGKSTLLRCLAGLERLNGTILVDGETWQDDHGFLEPHRRGVGYVAQGAPLLPNLTLRQTIRFVERRRPLALPFDDAVTRTGSATLLDRRTTTLSGGERQRAALCVALVAARRLLLLDEPLSALDDESRAEMRTMLATLLPSLPVVSLIVSHDREDILDITATQIEIRGGKLSG